MDKKKHIIKLRQTINPRTGNIYTYREIGILAGCSSAYAQQVVKPLTAERQRRNYLQFQHRRALRRSTGVIERRFDVLATEDWLAAFQLLGRLQAKLKERQNV